MPLPHRPLQKIDYKQLNSRQQENYNFQKVSAVLADYGFATLRLSDDWQRADFIAAHVGGSFLKVQLKGRLTLDCKYLKKEIWVCFNYKGIWYLYPHDEAVKWALEHMPIGDKERWKRGIGSYTYPYPPRKFLAWLAEFAIKSSSAGMPMSM